MVVMSAGLAVSAVAAVVRSPVVALVAAVVLGAAYGIAVGLAFVAPYAALAIHAVSAGYYAFDQATVEPSGQTGRASEITTSES